MKTERRISARTIIIITIVAILVIGAALATVLILGLSTGTKISDLTAKFSEIVGSVEVKKGAQDQYSPVNDGFLMTTAMQLQTMPDSRVRLDLSTGSIVRVGASTIFSLNSQQSNSNGALSQLELQAGRIWIVLNGGNIDVSTPGGVASVRGSYMFVWVVPNTATTTVCCLEGVCQYSNGGGIVNLTSGQKVITSDPNTLPTIQKMDQSDVQLWLDNVPEAGSIVPQVESLIATSTPTENSVVPTDTLTPTITLTPTSSIPMVSVSTDTNCRTGPDTVYDIRGILRVGENAQVVGRNSTSDYWVIILPSNNSIICWVWGNYATVTGNTSNIPIVNPPPTPTPTITPTPTETNTPTPTITDTPSPTNTQYLG